MLDWDTLRTVLAVHRMGGLSGAARDLQVSQPTVSRRLAKAEADLETKLFDRSQGRLIATEAGLIVVRETEQVEQRLRRMEDSVRQLDNDVSGMLIISAPQQLLPYYVAEEMHAFRELHPDITFNVRISDQIADVSNEKIDIVFRAEMNPKPSLWGYRLADLGHSYFAHPSLIETFGCPSTEAAGIPLVIHDGQTSSSQEESSALFPNGKLAARSNSLEATVALIAAGVGVGRLPHLVAQHYPDLVPVARPDSGPLRSLWILTHNDMRSVRRVEAFIEFVAERVQAKRALFNLGDAFLTDQIEPNKTPARF